MDVTLVLTHRCNLACDYCYAGEHYKKEMDDATLTRAVELLYADGARQARLGFFGGEPLLAEPLMRRAVSLARQQAQRRGAQLVVSCTTNATLVGPAQASWLVESGARVTVSIDGVREAHEAQRPTAGGDSSFEKTFAGLRQLLVAGADPAAMMVVTPRTAPFLYQSVRWLWDQGVRGVHANVDVAAVWSAEAREELGRELVCVGREQLARNLGGAPVSFDPFEVSAGRSGDGDAAQQRDPRIVVATSGHLYSCAPMVGEDRDDGPEAALRVGHIDEPAERIVAASRARASGCGEGGACACAAFLETGDPTRGGPVGLWWGAVCRRIGFAIAAALEDQGADVSCAPSPRRRRRRRGLIGWIAAVGGVLVGGGLYLHHAFAPTNECDSPRAQWPRPSPNQTLGALAAPPEPKRPLVAGKMLLRPVEPKALEKTKALKKPKATPEQPKPQIDGEMR